MSAAADTISAVRVVSAERRADTGRKYHFQIEVAYTSGKTDRVWRRFTEFDALYQTMFRVMGPGAPLPKLTAHYFVKSARQATIVRMGQLQVFLAQLLTFRTNAAAHKTIMFFLHPTAADIARAQQSDPTDIIRAVSAREDKPTQRALVTKDHRADSDLEISLSKGSVIKLLSTDNSEWFVGEDESGHVGRLPAACVEVMSNEGKEQAAAAAVAKPKTPLEELRTSELAYMRGLVDVRTDYFPRIRSIISAVEAKTFFSNWAELIPASQDLLTALEADPIVALATHLPALVPVYSKYCAGIPAAQALYERKLNDKTFFEFESSFSHLNKPTLNYIMRPVQRIMKYPLLIHEIRKGIPKDSPENGPLDIAHKAATQLAETANNSMSGPVQRLDKVDISNPDKETFQVVASTATATSPEDSAILSMQGPEVWLQIEQALNASIKLLTDLVTETMNFEEWHSLMLDRAVQRIRSTDTGPASALWDVMAGTGEMQCEMAGDMHTSLASLSGSMAAAADHCRQRLRELSRDRDALGSVQMAVGSLQRMRLAVEQDHQHLIEAQERLRATKLAAATDEKNAASLPGVKKAADKATEDYARAVGQYGLSHAQLQSQLVQLAQGFEGIDVEAFAQVRTALDQYFTFYTRRNETATAVLESSLLKLAAREPKFCNPHLTTAAIAETVLPPRHEFAAWTDIPLHDAPTSQVWIGAERLRATATDAGRVLTRVVAGRIMPVLRRLRAHTVSTTAQMRARDDSFNEDLDASV